MLYSSIKAHHLSRKGELNSDSKIQKRLYYLGWSIHTTFSEIGNKNQVSDNFYISKNLEYFKHLNNPTERQAGWALPILTDVSPSRLGHNERVTPWKIKIKSGWPRIIRHSPYSQSQKSILDSYNFSPTDTGLQKYFCFQMCLCSFLRV